MRVILLLLLLLSLLLLLLLLLGKRRLPPKGETRREIGIKTEKRREARKKERTGPEFALSLCSFSAAGSTSAGTGGSPHFSWVLTAHTVTAGVTLAGAALFH